MKSTEKVRFHEVPVPNVSRYELGCQGKDDERPYSTLYFNQNYCIIKIQST
jgi:hypothetical protein